MACDPAQVGAQLFSELGLERGQEEGLDRQRFRGKRHVAISGSRKETPVAGQGEDGTARPALTGSGSVSID